MLRSGWDWLNSHAQWLFLGGLAASAAWNLLKWRQDRELAIQIRDGQQEPGSLSATPKVSVLVAAWNEAKNIRPHIESFQNLRYPNKELILCAGGDDGTYEQASSYIDGQIRVIEQHAKEGKQHALRRGFQLASGDLVFLTDGDCLFNDRAFESTLCPLINEGEAVATGPFSPMAYQRANPFVRLQWCTDSYARARSPKYIEGIIGRNAAISREVLVACGGFGDDVSIGTDYYLARQMIASGFQIRYVHDSIVETEYKTSVPGYLKQQSRWIRNILIHGKAFGAQHQVRSALAQCIVGTIMTLWPLSLPLTRKVGFVNWLILLLHGSLSRFRYIAFSEHVLREPRTWRVYQLAPLALLLDQAMLAYALAEWIIPHRRRRW